MIIKVIIIKNIPWEMWV